MTQVSTAERLKLAQARRVELLNEKTAGETVPIEDVRRTWLGIRETIKRRLSLIGPRIAAAGVPNKVVEIVEREVAAALSELADDPI
ncbi:MAG TPA: hypothetical protein VG651_00365 [Stellaceae bacterium]|nr:hypothetical protein [Stellaceae bacterium]